MHPKDFFLSNQSEVSKQTCFVVMPFAKAFDPVYEAIRAAVEGPELNYSCSRADELLGGGPILGNILSYAALQAVRP